MRPLVVLLVLNLEAIRELNAPRTGRLEDLSQLFHFLNGLGVHTYASQQDRAAVNRLLAEIADQSTRLFWLGIVGGERRFKVYDDPPEPPRNLAALHDDPVGWLREWQHKADLVLLDNRSYEVFDDVAVTTRSPDNLYFQVSDGTDRDLTVCRVTHWQTAPLRTGEGAVIQKGMQRDEVAATLFDPLIRYPASISILDQYLASSTVRSRNKDISRLKSPRKGGLPAPAFDPDDLPKRYLEWMVGWIADHREGKWTLDLFGPAVRTSRGDEYPHAMISDVLDQILERVRRTNSTGKLPRMVRLIDATELLKGKKAEVDSHPRWLFLEGHAAIAIDAGFDVFDEDHVHKSSDVHCYAANTVHYEHRAAEILKMGQANLRSVWKLGERGYIRGGQQR